MMNYITKYYNETHHTIENNSYREYNNSFDFTKWLRVFLNKLRFHTYLNLILITLFNPFICYNMIILFVCCSSDICRAATYTVRKIVCQHTRVVFLYYSQKRNLYPNLCGLQFQIFKNSVLTVKLGQTSIGYNNHNI